MQNYNDLDICQVFKEKCIQIVYHKIITYLLLNKRYILIYIRNIQ